MRNREFIAAVSLATSLLSASACGGSSDSEPTTPALILNVNCDQNPHDITDVSFAEPELLKYKDKPITVEIQDARAEEYLKFTMIGNTAVNGHSITSESAGEVLAALPQAKLYAGVPQHGQNRYYAGDEGITLACNDAQPADVFLP